MKNEKEKPIPGEKEILSTQNLDRILTRTKPDELGTFLEENRESLIISKNPFAEYMRERIRNKKLTQHEVFINADIGEKYGYQVIAQEKRARHRDTVLRLCLGAHFSLTETQRALELYGFNALYSRIPRDAVLIFAFNRSLWDPHTVNRLLEKYGEKPLRPCGEES